MLAAKARLQMNTIKETISVTSVMLTKLIIAPLKKEILFATATALP